MKWTRFALLLLFPFLMAPSPQDQYGAAAWRMLKTLEDCNGAGEVLQWDLTTADFSCTTASSGAPTTADYLVGTTQGGLSAEIVVGASPGGELGGTWASPTIDSGVVSLDEIGDFGCSALQIVRRNAGDTAFECAASAGGGDSGRVEDGDNAGTFTALSDFDLDDGGDINFVRAAGPPDVVTAEIRAGAVGATEASGLDAGDITTSAFADARVDGSLEADEVNPTLGTQTQGNYVASVATTAPITGGAAGSEGATLTLALNQNAGTDVTADLEEDAHCSEHDSADVNCTGETIVIANVPSGATVSIDETEIQLSAPDVVVGRDTAGAGGAEEIGLGASLVMNGFQLKRAELTGDVTAPENSNSTTVVDDSHNHGTSTVAGLDAGDITTSAFADARVDGSLEADEVVGTETDEALCSWEATGSLVECDLTTTTGGRSILATTPADDQVYVGDSASAGTWRAIPDCGEAGTLNYTASTNSFSCLTDGGGGGGGLSYADAAAAALAGF